MSVHRIPRRLLLALLAGGLFLTAGAAQQPVRPGIITLPRTDTTTAPKLEAVAETKLLMEGLAQSNFRGLSRLLRTPPQDGQTWQFLRGQALLLAETGNLLMLRPPRNAGQKAWLDRCAELRDQATRVARQAAARDYTRTQAAVQDLARTCNHCHRTFRIPVTISEEAPSARTTE
jgi:hypothetical protein